eukprot:GGOE01000811.1.p1 GENE.GGOE01000811.1~~GGOE01000811.1.p1  ORF type:complete len:269 (+),score=84.29 GGOE01000811.1:29-835(+)
MFSKSDGVGATATECDLESPPYAKQEDVCDLLEEDAASTECTSNVDLAQSSGIHINLRNAFLRRVYGLLTSQLVVTTALCAFCSLNEAASGMLLGSPQAFMYGSIIPTIGILISLHFVKNVHPWNAILLFAFTLFESLSLGVISASYAHMGMGDVLISAAGLTMAVFLCLTGFVLLSKKDFSFLGGFLFAALFVMVGWGLLNIIFGWRVHFLYSALGALLFSAFILYDTSCILLKYSYDEHIIASIQLYLDIVNLFLYILRLLSGSRN